MALILKQVFAFLKLLNSETGHNSLAAGIAAGFILGMSPALSLQALLVFLCIFIFRIQMGAAFVSAFFFAFIGWILDPAFDAFGRSILEADALKGLWTAMYNMPLVPLTRFNNSIVMGAGVLAILLSPVIYFLSLYLILKYRETVVARIKNTKFWKAIQATKFYNWYYSYDKYFG
jgi:uncharacterized protein (TIGR03546 family)